MRPPVGPTIGNEPPFIPGSGPADLDHRSTADCHGDHLELRTRRSRFVCGVVRVHLGVGEDFRSAKKAHPALLVEDLESV
jgi:hypothetical protein